jgi:hypothetical protein
MPTRRAICGRLGTAIAFSAAALLSCASAQAAEPHPTSVAVSCDTTLVAFEPAKCQVTVTDTALETPAPPAGTVSLEASSEGVITPAPACELTPVPASEERISACTVTYEPVQSGMPTITATYPTDGAHTGSTTTVMLTVEARTTSLAVSCGSGVTLSQPAACTATVTDTSGSAHPPSGAVSFASDTSGGAFTPEASCSLSSVPSAAQASCAVQYTPGQLGSGVHTITAQYAGDAAHALTRSSGALTVSAPPPVITTTPPSTPPSSPTPTPPAAVPERPKCRVKARERAIMRAAKRSSAKTKTFEILVSYRCDQSAAVRVGGSIVIAGATQSGKHSRAQTLKLRALTSRAVPGGRQPALVLVVPARVATALSHGAKASTAVEFTVSNANGIGVATIRFNLAP